MNDLQLFMLVAPLAVLVLACFGWIQLKRDIKTSGERIEELRRKIRAREEADFRELANEQLAGGSLVRPMAVLKGKLTSGTYGIQIVVPARSGEKKLTNETG